MRAVFMGSPESAVPALVALAIHPHIELVCVYTQPPRPKGRGGNVQNTPVHDAALARGIEVRTPLNFNNEADIDAFNKLQADVAIVAAYGIMLPDEILHAPKYGCLNIHPSLLPRWRGVSPIQFALWKGDQKTGISVMRLVKEMDAGPILAQEEIPITPGSTAQNLSDALWPMGVKLLMNVLEDLVETGTLHPKEQDHAGATFCHMLTKEHGHIDWSQSADEIDRMVRALNPWPGTWSVFPDGKRLKILSAQITQGAGKAGEILEGGRVACGREALILTSVQPEGKKPMDRSAALNGGYLKAGEILS